MGEMKAFVSDLDGTLYFADRDIKISTEDIEAIREFQACGGKFGISTGRMYSVVKDILGESIRPDFCICSSGATVYDEKGEFLSKRSINRNIAEDIMDYAERQGFKSRLHIDTDKKITDVTVHFADPDLAKRFAGYINHQYFQYVAAFRNDTSVNIIPIGCSKGLGIREVQKHFEITWTAAIGDNVNDKTLFERVNEVFAMSSGDEKVRESANHVVDSVAEALRIFEDEDVSELKFGKGGRKVVRRD